MKICYISVVKPIYPRDISVLDGLKKLGIEVYELYDDSPHLKKIWRLWKRHREIKNRYDFIIIGYTGYVLIPFFRFFTRKRIIFNALCSLYEGCIISRGEKRIRKKIYFSLIDFIAFHFSSMVSVESDSQKEFIAKRYFLKKTKIITVRTGTIDNYFLYDPKVEKNKIFTVLFRGNLMPESGIQHAIEAAIILKNRADIKFKILGNGNNYWNEKVSRMINENSLDNVDWIKDKLSFEELKYRMLQSHLSLGQLGNHSRLARTIPHKVFDSLALKIPILTARNKAVLELLEENATCFCFNPADSKDLARKILEIKDQTQLREDVRERAYKLYKENLTSKTLAKKLIDLITKAK
ncbi:MAG: glycosyltransferase [Patescibacteria group bacterium]|nr:glycosyltransferase [Patescibacteria group bacterium]